MQTAKPPLTYDLIIIGAGAAGLVAAGRAAQGGARVLLLEKMRRAGRKLLITGKGRCNITHDAPASVYYQNIFPNGRFLKHAFHTFFVKDILKILHDQGVPTTTERGSRVFPVSNNAADVVNALMQWMGKKNIDILYDTRATRLLTKKDSIEGVEVLGENGQKQYFAPNVLICTG